MPKGKPKSSDTKANHDAQRMETAAYNMLSYLEKLLSEWEEGYPIIRRGKELDELKELVSSAKPVPQTDMVECTWVNTNQTASNRHENMIHVTYGDRQFTLCNTPTKRPNTHSYQEWYSGCPDKDHPRCQKCVSLSGIMEWIC